MIDNCTISSYNCTSKVYIWLTPEKEMGDSGLESSGKTKGFWRGFKSCDS